jgi:hypothetical protein
MYMNGASTTTAPALTINTNTTTLTLGDIADGNFGLNGTLDEVRISNIARSANWITTEYNNQSAPSSFYALGAQQSVAHGSSTLIIIQ